MSTSQTYRVLVRQPELYTIDIAAHSEVMATDGPDGVTYWRVDQLPKAVDPDLVWTIVEGDRHLWLRRGFCIANRIDYVLCFVPWTEDNPKQPHYRYH